MNNLYRTLISCCFVLLLSAMNSQAQNNNLAAGDIAFVSYQSDLDLSNEAFGGPTKFTDRFSIAVTKSGGLPAGTVIFFTDDGWSTSTNNFIVNTEGFIKWTVPAGGVAVGTEVYFISSFDDGTGVTTWAAYTTESGTTTLGTVTTESGTNYLELSSGGDQILAYQAGPTGGPAGAYNNATRRFIAALHANIEDNLTTYTNWDGNAPTGGNQSSVPPGLTNGTTALLLSQAATLPVAVAVPTDEPDNGKFTTPNPAAACSALGLATIINTRGNWTYSGAAFAIGASSNKGTYTLNNPVSITTPPGNASVCDGLSASFSVVATGTATLTYQWQESTDAAFTSPVTLTNTGVYSGVTTNTLTISNTTGLGGRYYRAVVTNTCGSVNSASGLLTLSSTLPTNSIIVTQATNTNNNLYYQSCTLITKVVPSGASQVTGNVTAQVWVESAVPTFANQPFVARHYQITPATNAATATGRVTLYFTQAEFNAFNAAAGSTLDLPTGPTDVAGKSNLRVGKYSGSSNNSTGLPGSYTSTVTVLDPVDNDIVWNATYSRWEVTVDVTGFSGFIIQTSAIALPLNLLSFSGNLNNNDVLLQWQTSDEINHAYFEIERSTDGQTYTAVGQIAGTNGNLVQNYSWVDAGAGLLNTSKLFYRLKMVSTTGTAEYSSIILIPLKSFAPVVEVSPNPFTSRVNISLQMAEAAQLSISLSDITGKLLRSEKVKVPKGLTVHPVTGMDNLKQGLYILSVKFNGQTHTYKIVK